MAVVSQPPVAVAQLCIVRHKTMTKPLRKLLTVVLISLAALVILVSFSAFRAYRISQSHIQNTLPPPLYGIQFALHPNCYIDGDRELGFKPGWVVTYAPRSKNYGTGFLSLSSAQYWDRGRLLSSPKFMKMPRTTSGNLNKHLRRSMRQLKSA